MSHSHDATGAATLLRRLWQVVDVTASVCRSNRSLITVPSTIGIIESAYRLDSTLPSALSRRPLHTTMQLIASRECTLMHAARRPPGQTPTYPGAFTRRYQRSPPLLPSPRVLSKQQFLLLVYLVACENARSSSVDHKGIT